MKTLGVLSSQDCRCLQQQWRFSLWLKLLGYSHSSSPLWWEVTIEDLSWCQGLVGVHTTVAPGHGCMCGGGGSRVQGVWVYMHMAVKGSGFMMLACTWWQWHWSLGFGHVKQLPSWCLRCVYGGIEDGMRWRLWLLGDTVMWPLDSFVSWGQHWQRYLVTKLHMSTAVTRAAIVLLLFSFPLGGGHGQGIRFPLGAKLCWTGRWGDTGKMLPIIFYTAMCGLCPIHLI